MARSRATPEDKRRGQALASLLKAGREHRATTQRALADEADIALDTLRAIEAGRSASPAFFTVAALAEALELRLDDLARQSRREPQ